jgi:hypothetical protein
MMGPGSVSTLPLNTKWGSTSPDLFIPGSAVPSKLEMGRFLVKLSSLGLFPSIEAGDTGQGGYMAAGDILTQTIDGFDLNNIWNEFQAAIAIVNAQRTLLTQLLTFPVTSNIERVAQISQASFEIASEYGEPRALRPVGSFFVLGYDIQDYDIAARFTWKFLRDAPATQVEAINAMVIEADNRLIYNKVMDSLYNPVNRIADINGSDVNVYALYNNDGTVPPKYKTNTFLSTHTHYLTSGNVTVDPGDLDEMYEHVRHHGYSFENGVRHLLFVNPAQASQIMKFRVAGTAGAGLPSGASYDFIPSVGMPAMFLPTNVQIFNGQQPPAMISGIPVVGSYGPLIVLADDMFPAGYMALIASGGPENLRNPVGFREHANPSFRGLRLVKGPNPDYPLVDSFYQRTFGTGIRQRGGSVIMQVTAGAYAAPVFV